MYSFSKAISTFALMSTAFCFAGSKEKPSNIRVIKMDRTSEANNIEIVFQYPKEGELKTEKPLLIQIQLDGFPLGTNTEDPRNKEVKNDSSGQCLKLLIDNNEPIILTETNAPDDFHDQHDVYYEQTVEYKYDGSLSQGEHLLRVFPVYSYGENLTGAHTFTAETFYFGNKSGSSRYDLKAPYLTYNSPDGTFNTDKPILLDFYLSNCELSSDGYKVRLSIDDHEERTLTDWNPYYIYDLTPGKHKVKIELLDPKGKVVSGSLATAEKTITVK